MHPARTGIIRGFGNSGSMERHSAVPATDKNLDHQAEVNGRKQGGQAGVGEHMPHSPLVIETGMFPRRYFLPQCPRQPANSTGIDTD